MGYTCLYAPLELIQAAGLLPVRLLSPPGATPLAEAHLPPYTCHPLRASLELAVSGDLDQLSGVLLVQTCDAQKALPDLWQAAGRTGVVFFQPPTRLSGALAEAYLRAELVRVRDELEALTGAEISDESLTKALDAREEHRKKLFELYRKRRQNPSWLKGGDFASVILASFRLDPAACLTALEPILKVWPEHNSGEAAPVFLSGSQCLELDIYDQIEEAGGVVIDDDLCSGGRAVELDQPSNPSLDPWSRLCQNYLTRPHCPTKHHPDKDRGLELLARVKRSGARGLIIFPQKYCESHAFDHPRQRRLIEKAGLKSLLLETDGSGSGAAARQNRIQAFVEMLKDEF